MTDEEWSRKAFEDWAVDSKRAYQISWDNTSNVSIMFHRNGGDGLWDAWQAGVDWVEAGGPVRMEGDPK